MNLWVALAEGAAIASYNPMSGKQLAKVRCFLISSGEKTFCARLYHAEGS